MGIKMKLKLKPLVRMMTVLPVMFLPTSTALFASDLTIYSGNTIGKVSILLMLDTSGSMGISSLVLPNDNKYGSPGDIGTNTTICNRVDVAEAGGTIKEWAYNAVDRRTGVSTNNKTSFVKSVVINGKTITYYLRGCGNASLDSTGKMVETATGKFDRLSRLKDAIIQLLADTNKDTGIKDEVQIGLGNFSSQTSLTVGDTSRKLVDGHSGRISVPVAALTAAQREKIIQQLANLKSVDTTTNEDGTANANLKQSSTSYPDIFKASSGTPTAHAYAEAGAYMMGTTTGQDTNSPTKTTILYDGYSVMQKSDDTSQQVYYVCVGLTGESVQNASLPGVTSIMQCDNEWNKSEAAWYDATNKQMGPTIKIYKPNPDTTNKLQPWVSVTPADLKTQVGAMNSLWETHSKLPEGWRYGGWMKLKNEPMDIEPIVGVVWGNKGANNLVSYRSSPFSLKAENVPQTVTTQGFKDCPTGYNVVSGWASLCNKTGTFERNASATEIRNQKCSTPGDGSIDPLPNARSPDGTLKSDEHYNFARTSYNSNTRKCFQTDSAVIRPWGDIQKTTYISTPVDNNYGGIAYSAADTKTSNGYIQGGSTSSCDGNGIYMLTDGSPNSTKDNMAQTIMNTTLRDNASYKFSGKPSGTVLISPPLVSGLFSGETGGWEYIGEYAKKLRNRKDAADVQKNPLDMNIKTAVVGFGASFSGLTRNADNTYNCESAPNDDVKNACLWGSSSYGDGGFYYAESAEDIKKSIKDFIEDVPPKFEAANIGTISIPRDPLDQTKALSQGFFPMIQPTLESTARTWSGNLKKYYVVDGTLKSALTGGEAIFTVVNNKQVINSKAKDLWSNELTSADHSLINSGGALNKIPTPSTATEAVDAISNINSQRNVFIPNGASMVQVNKENLATDYSGTGLLPTTLTVNQRLALLNYLGYQTQFPTASTTLTTEQIAPLVLNPSAPYRFLGGVVHSTPLMVTKEATISGANIVGNRTEYTVYGSMDGGLHVVNASTGKELSVFVPEEIINNQYDTLSSQNSKGISTLTGLAYGVDAPWVADNTFKVETTTANATQTTKYTANKINIYGGLRMGGKAIYGLNILDAQNPKLLFHINPSTTGFGRLAQVWTKPTITDIRVKGVRKKVLIFGGGYDESVYEKSQASFTEPNSTYGNALYIVDAQTGALIWMTSANTTGVANAYQKTTQTDLKYSVVGQPTVRDYDADGLTDTIYFADLGGQVFRVDLNNANQMSTTTDTNIAVRVQTLAKLRTGSGSTEFVPRFYERLSTAVFDEGQNRFVLVTANSGNRSYPLEAEKGAANKVYGLIDRDAAANGLENSTFSPATTIIPTMLSNNGILGRTVNKQIPATDVEKLKLITGDTLLRGWSFELRSVVTGNYAKSFEESQLITGDLYVNLYDPKSTLAHQEVSGCQGGVTGVSTTHRICLPYGDCAAYVTTSYSGIVGPSFGPVTSSGNVTSLVGPVAATKEICVGKCPSETNTPVENTLYKYGQSRAIKPIRWFER